MDGGVDLFLIETIFDTLNSKAAIFALEELFEERDIRIPVFLNATIIDDTGRTLSGQTNEAFWNSVSHAKPFAVGLNCALSPCDLHPYVTSLSVAADCYVFCYPNDQDQDGVDAIQPFVRDGIVNALGGCGTGPEHIAAVRKMVEKGGYKPRKKPSVEPLMRISGLDSMNYAPAENMRDTYLYIGERCNVAGSSIYKKAIVDGNYDKAAGIAMKQVCMCLYVSLKAIAQLDAFAVFCCGRKGPAPASTSCTSEQNKKNQPCGQICMAVAD